MRIWLHYDAHEIVCKLVLSYYFTILLYIYYYFIIYNYIISYFAPKFVWVFATLETNVSTGPIFRYFGYFVLLTVLFKKLKNIWGSLYFIFSFKRV